jgi:hypothetical protein
MMVRYLIFEGEAGGQTARPRSLVVVEDLAFNFPSMEARMNKIFRSSTVLVLALVGLAGCDRESRTVGDVNPAHVAEAKRALRDLWIGHIFWVRQINIHSPALYLFLTTETNGAV